MSNLGTITGGGSPAAVSKEPEEPELERLLSELKSIRVDVAEEAQSLYSASQRLHRRSTAEGEETADYPEPHSYAERLSEELDILRGQVRSIRDSRQQIERAV